jgi:mannose-6-phosphate isomerase-like protein (cupin superfamily)
MPENDAKPGEYWMGPVEETYYCIHGQLTLMCDGDNIEFGPNDAVYLAPGALQTHEHRRRGRVLHLQLIYLATGRIT